MATVLIGAGSNLGDRLAYLQQASSFLKSLASPQTFRKSSVWESEPVGPAEHSFLNSAALLKTTLTPATLLLRLKKFEADLGREANPKRWGPRILDLDILAYDHLVIHEENLIIPHPEYHRRLFVLLPLQELSPDWMDPKNGTAISTMIEQAPELRIQKTELIW